MDADINSILVGYRGKSAMLKAIYGSKDEEPPTPKPKPTKADFKAFAKAQNSRKNK